MKIPHVSIKSVYNFVLNVRNKHQLLKIFDAREYSQVEQLPYGQQAQVDFGEYNMTDVDGQRRKAYFFAMVLSRTRFKFVALLKHNVASGSVYTGIDGSIQFRIYRLSKSLFSTRQIGGY